MGKVNNSNKPSVEEIRSLLSYDPLTGIFTWKVDITSGRGKKVAEKGQAAGGDSGNGYIRIGINGKKYCAHQSAFVLYFNRWPDFYVDHRNQKRSDNRIENLREASEAENSQNNYVNTRRKNRTSTFRGVSRRDTCMSYPWRASITLDGKVMHLGYFAEEEQAALAYLEAKKRLHPFASPPEE